MDDNLLDSYGLFSKAIHWITAFIILALLAVGLYMGSLESSPQKILIYNLHKSFGLLVLALVFVRVVWHLIHKKPKSLPTHKKWEVWLSHSIHGFLYILLFALPISGWVMSSAGDYNVKLFFVNMPDIVSKNEGLYETAEEVHEILAWVIIALVGLHVLGALKHYFVDKDKTLERMTWARISIVPAILLFGFVALIYGFIAFQSLSEELEIEHEHKDHSAFEQNDQNYAQEDLNNMNLEVFGVTKWNIDKKKSAITFKATQYGQKFEGNFDFRGQIFFDPEILDKSKAIIDIDMKSIKTGSIDRDNQARSKDWFDVATYPKAIFETDGFIKVDVEGNYLAKGRLTLRGVTLPVDLPFNLKIKERQGGKISAVMKSEIELSRLSFGIGQGQWSDEGAIGDKVAVDLFVVASNN